MVASDRFFLRKRYLFWIFAILCLCFILFKIKSVLLPFYISFAVVILFSGIVGKIERKFHIPRAISSAIVTLSVVSFIIYAFIITFNNVFAKATMTFGNAEYRSNFVNGVNDYFGGILQKYNFENTFNFVAGQFSDLCFEFFRHFSRNLIGYSADFASMVFLFSLTPIVMFMMLKDMPKIKSKFYKLLPQSIQSEAKKLFSDVHESVFKYLEGQTLACIILSILYAVVLFPIGLEHFILLGVIIGFSAFVPYIGFYLATTITLLSAYRQFGDVKIVITTFVAMLALQIVDSGFITPKVVGNKLGIHPLVVIFGVLVSVPLFGILGILFALPLVGVVCSVAKFFFKKYKSSSYYKDGIVV